MKLLIIIILFVGIFLLLKKRNTIQTDEKKDERKFISKNIEYKKKDIKSFDLTNIKPKYLKQNQKNYAETSKDKIIITDNLGNTIGTIRKNEKIYNEINRTENKKIVCWLSGDFEGYNDTFYIRVNIPVKYTREELSKIENIFKLENEIHNLENKKDITINEYFNIMNNYLEIKDLLSKINNPEEIPFYFNLNNLPRLSKKLEQNKQWDKLIELEKYSVFFDKLNERYKKSLFKRIEIAKKMIN